MGMGVGVMGTVIAPAVHRGIQGHTGLHRGIHGNTWPAHGAKGGQDHTWDRTTLKKAIKGEGSNNLSRGPTMAGDAPKDHQKSRQGHQKSEQGHVRDTVGTELYMGTWAGPC